MRYALQAIRRRPARSAATALGIGLATALVVMLLAVSAGVQQSSVRLAASSGIDLLAASANTSLESGAFPPVTHAHLLPSQLPQADPNVATASPWLLNALVFANTSLYDRLNSSTIPPDWSPTGAGAVGWIPETNRGLEVPAVTNGTGLSQPGDPHYANGSYSGPSTHEVVLDAGLAQVLAVHPGQQVWASPQGVANASGLRAWFHNATLFRVTGTSSPFWLIPSALIGFFYLSELQSLVGSAGASTDYASLVLIHLSQNANPATDQQRLEHAYPQLTVFTVANILGQVQQTVNLYRTFGTLIGVIAVVVATLFTATVLLMSVDDRSRELALLRAIGYPPAAVGRLVLEEGLLFSGLGLLIGLGGGLAGAFGLNLFLERATQNLPAGFAFVSFDPSVIASGVIEVLGIGLVASILPAVRAMQLSIAEELRAP